MTWIQRHRLRAFFRSSLWPIPLACMVAAPLVARLTLWVDHQIGWTLNVSADDARAVTGTLVGSLLTFIVFIFSFLLVAVQLASAQFSPRVIARVFRDPYTKAALSVFAFMYSYSLVLLSRVKDPVPLVSGVLCGYGSLACMAVFLLLIDRLGKELRPVRILAAVAAEGRKAIQGLYPHLLSAAHVAPSEPPLPGELPRVVNHRGEPGVVLAFDDAGLLKMAGQADGVIELVPQVGDFLAPGDPLFRIYLGGQTVDEESLHRSVAIGPERTLEQDPAFAFRIIVDIASKALSPAINDPTTAVLAIDQIHHLLRQVGSRLLDTGFDRDVTGRLRLVYRTPDWEDFVQLAVTEIRQFGSESIQVSRRLRAMLDNLIHSLPESRRSLLRQELQLLHRSVERSFPEPDDRTLAEVGDSQGVGGTDGGASWKVVVTSDHGTE
jgi:uncharacterized membrane protein